MSEHTSTLLVPVEECIFNNQEDAHEHEADYLRELLYAQLLGDEEIQEDDYIIVIGYEAVALEEGFVKFNVSYEHEEP